MRRTDEAPRESLETCLQGQARLDMDRLDASDFTRLLEAKAALDPRSALFVELDMVEMAPRQEIEQRLGIPPGEFAAVKAKVMSGLRDLMLKRR